MFYFLSLLYPVDKIDINTADLDQLELIPINNEKIILIHDYHSDGIQKAIKEFKNDNEIYLIELTGSQAMIIKN